VKGRNIAIGRRITVVTLFAVAFLGGAVAAFALVYGLGRALNTEAWPVDFRALAAGMVLFCLALSDLYAFYNKTYSPLSVQRQTPRVVMRRYRPEIVVLIWGLDTGLAATTFRVAAATWGSFILVFLAFGTWWTGLFYGVAFVLPLMLVIWGSRVGRAAYASEPVDPGLGRLAAARPAAQLASAALLALSGWVLIDAGLVSSV
jgi:hypothetical protein